MRTVTVAAADVRAAVLAAEAVGESLLHDDRLADGRHRLTFVTPAEDPREQRVAAPRTRADALREKLAGGDLTLGELNELARLERGL